MNIPRVALLLVAMNLLAVLELAEPSMGRLGGTVTDINEGRIHGATVAVTSEGITRATTTDEDGTYKLELPSGTYRITVSGVGFCPSRRGAFRIEPSTTATFNFSLIPCPISNDLRIVAGQYKGETDRYRDPFKSEIFPVKQLEGAPLELMVRYGTRRVRGKLINYRGGVVTYDEHAETPAGFVRRSNFLGVTVAYNHLLIQAESVSLDPRTLRFEAMGNVILEDGKQQAKGTTIRVRFSNSKAIIEQLR